VQGRPILQRCLILSQTSAGEGVGYLINGLLASHCSFVRALLPFVRPGLRVHRRAARRRVNDWTSSMPAMMARHDARDGIRYLLIR
jgi:hypothetical protein